MEFIWEEKNRQNSLAICDWMDFNPKQLNFSALTIILRQEWIPTYLLCSLSIPSINKSSEDKNRSFKKIERTLLTQK